MYPEHDLYLVKIFGDMINVTDLNILKSKDFLKSANEAIRKLIADSISDENAKTKILEDKLLSPLHLLYDL